MRITLTIARRLAVGSLVLLAVSFFVFVGIESLPGDAALAALGHDATPESIAAFRREFGLDRPVLLRYQEWIAGFFAGDLGRSTPSGLPVSDVIGPRALNTLALALATVAFLVPLALLLGAIAAIKRDGFWDHLIGSATLGLIAVPDFVVGTLLALFVGVKLGWLPPVSLIDTSVPFWSRSPETLVLPVLTLLAASVAQTSRMVRACLIDALESDYVMAAELRGVPRWRVLALHAFLNALGPTLQLMALNVAWLMGGVVVVEMVFQYSGIGSALVTAVSTQDLPTVQALVMFFAAIFIVLNLLVDIGVDLLNPQVRRGGV